MLKLRNSIPLLFSFLFVFSCQEKAKNDTPENFSKAIFNALKFQDFKSVSAFVITKADTANFKSKGSIKEIKEAILAESKGENTDRFWNRSELAFEDLIKEGESRGINWGEIVFSEVTYNKRLNFFEDFFTYFLYEGEEYRFRIRYAEETKTGIKDFILTDLINVADEIERLENEDYYPDGLQIHYQEYSYKFNIFNPNIINDFEFEIINYSNVEVDYVKYSISLVTEGDYLGRGKKVFQRTYELEKKVYPNDIIRIRVDDIVDLNTGVDASISGNLFLNGEIIDAKPHPKFKR